MKTHKDIRLRESCLTGNLFGFDLLVIVQANELAVLLRKGVDGLLHTLQEGLMISIILRSGGRGNVVSPGFALALQLIESRVYGYGHEPWAKRVVAPVGQPLLGTDEGLLGHLFGEFLTSHNGQRLREYHSRIAFHDLSETTLVAVAKHFVYKFPVCHNYIIDRERR